jgi:hypothetical protein
MPIDESLGHYTRRRARLWVGIFDSEIGLDDIIGRQHLVWQPQRQPLTPELRAHTSRYSKYLIRGNRFSPARLGRLWHFPASRIASLRPSFLGQVTREPTQQRLEHTTAEFHTNRRIDPSPLLERDLVRFHPRYNRRIERFLEDYRTQSQRLDVTNQLGHCKSGGTIQGVVGSVAWCFVVSSLCARQCAWQVEVAVRYIRPRALNDRHKPANVSDQFAV